MNAAGERAGRTPTAGFDAARAARWAAAVTTVLVLVQAVLAGRGWFVDVGLIEVHGWVGNATFLAVVGQVVLACAARNRWAAGRAELGLSALLLVLVVAQIGLGYGGRESSAAASWHVPNGVLIFGVTAAILALALPRRAGTTA